MKAHDHYAVSQLAMLLARILLVLIFCCNTRMALSQILKGHVYENNTSIALDSVKIKVFASTEISYTDRNGDFKIRAQINDLLIISGFGYETDTLLVINTLFQEIYLMPRQHLLKEVKINANSTVPARSFGIYDPDFHNQTIAKQIDANGNYKGGISIRIWYWKKDEKRKAKNERTFKADSAYREIPKIFCRDTILKYLPLKNEEISGFILRYSPSLDEFMSPAFNLALYLNKCYKEYKEHPLDDSVKNPIF